jgi:hypothetical protein
MHATMLMQVNQAPTICFHGSQLVIPEDTLVTLSDFLSFSAGGSDCSKLGGVCASADLPADACGNLLPSGTDALQTVDVEFHIPTPPCSPFNCTDPGWEPQESFLRLLSNGTIQVFACNGGNISVNVTVIDSEGAKTTRSLLVVVQEANDEPRFVMGNDTIYILEDSVDMIPGFASRISPGRCEGSQTLTFSIEPVRYWVPYVAGAPGETDFPSHNPHHYLVDPSSTFRLFSTSVPVMDAFSGNLSYELDTDKHGRVDFDVILQDSGGDSAGTNQRTRSLTFYVLPVNDAPMFSLSQTAITITNPEVLGTEETVWRENGIATSITKGGWSEENQHVIFSMEILSGPERLFVPLRIDCGADIGFSKCTGATGDLYAMPRPRRFGTNVIQVRIIDDGGEPDYALLSHGTLGAPRPVNTSLAVGTVTLTLTQVYQKPLFYLATDRVRVLQDSGCVTTIPGWDYLWGSACNRSVARRYVRACAPYRHRILSICTSRIQSMVHLVQVGRFPLSTAT